MQNLGLPFLTEFNRRFEPPANHHSKASSSKEEKWLQAYHARTEYFEIHGPLVIHPTHHAAVAQLYSMKTMIVCTRISSSFMQSPEDKQAPDTRESDAADCPRSPPATKPSFNPNAAPFVPSQATVGSTRSQTPPVMSDHPWMDTFWHGTSTEDLGEQRFAAERMIITGTWSFGNICALAQMLCWECIHPATYALFARAVYDALKTHYGEWESSCFRFHLRKCALESFRITWSTVHPQAISVYNPPTPEYLQYAYPSVSSSSPSFLHVEHVYVLQNMVLCAKETLWHGPDSDKLMKGFIANFAQRTSSLPDHASFGPPASIAFIIREAGISRKISEWYSRRPACPIVDNESIWS
ncbi:hypothetical protein BU15DRAFT_73577 [Melanogaster broomeanus]|nr:hypothetical protein BU15DRAFT_73577 [Melanogaster broomeanus]